MKSFVLTILLASLYGYLFAAQIRPVPSLFLLPTIPTEILVRSDGAEGAFTSLPPAVAAVTCGDTIKVRAGDSWDVPSIYLLPNKGCATGSEPRITTTGTLPEARVSPALASEMPRFRAVNSDGIFRFAAGAGWVLDGLNLTDNNGTATVNMLVDARASNTRAVVTRSLLYPKEAVTAPTNYQRALIRAVWWSGTLRFEKNYAWGFSRRNAKGESQDRSILLTMRTDEAVITDNFLEDNYMAIFTGGGGEEPEFTGTLANPTMTSAAISNTAGLVAGATYGRFEARGDAVFTSISSGVASFTRSSGPAFTADDIDHTVWLSHTNGKETWRGRITAVNGDNVTLEPYGGPPPQLGASCKFTEFMVARITEVSGGSIKFDGSKQTVGNDWLTKAPSTAPDAVGWRLNQAVRNLLITRNTFSIDVAMARAEYALSKNNPKGWMEFKAGDGSLVDGNEFINYPSVIAFTQHSNEGYTPWTKIKNVTVTNNYVHPIYDANASRQFIILAETDPYNSDEPGCCNRIENNLVLNCVNIMQSSGNRETVVRNNTVVNDHSSPIYGSMTVVGDGVAQGWQFTDNIVFHLRYGMTCFVAPNTLDTCYRNRVFQRNVVVDTESAGVNVNTWGTGSILAPVPTSLAQVGFVDPAKNDYRLSGTSPYKGKAENGSDPGVNWERLVAGLGFDPTGAPVNPTPSPTATPTPVPTPQPTATPTPSPSVTPTPVPTPVCTMTTSNPVVPEWGFGKLVVTLSGFNSPSSVSVTATSGQVTVSPPRIRSVSGSSVIVEFGLQAKKKSANVTVVGPCGSKSVLVNVQ